MVLGGEHFTVGPPASWDKDGVDVEEIIKWEGGVFEVPIKTTAKDLWKVKIASEHICDQFGLKDCGPGAIKRALVDNFGLYADLIDKELMAPETPRLGGPGTSGWSERDRLFILIA